MAGDKKKILYIAHGHPDFAKGGAELAAYHMYESMKASGEYEPFLLARVGDPHFVHPGIALTGHRYDDHCTMLYTPLDEYDFFFDSFMEHNCVWGPAYAYIDFLKTLRPDIIHFHHYTQMGIDFLRLAKDTLPGVKLIVTLHEFMPICPNKGSMLKTNGQLCYQSSPQECFQCIPERDIRDFFLRERLFKSNLAVAEHIITPSHFLKGRLVAWGLEDEKITVMENGRPIWPKRPRKPYDGNRSFVVAYIGQIVFHKGVEVFLRAIAEYRRLRDRYLDAVAKAGGGGLPVHVRPIPDIRFSIHGTRGGLPKDLEKEIDELLEECADDIHLYGGYDPRQLHDLLMRADCIVVPSIWWENSPLTIQEAFMADVPVVCSGIGGLAEKVTDGVNGLHFLVRDHVHLLERLIELAESPELHARLVEGIPTIFSDTEMAEQMHEMYGGLFASQEKVSSNA